MWFTAQFKLGPRGNVTGTESLDKLKSHDCDSECTHLFMEVNNPGSFGRTFHHGHACLGGRCLDEEMVHRAVEGLEEAMFRSADMETSGGLTGAVMCETASSGLIGTPWILKGRWRWT